ncbi:transposase [Enterococcus avium]|nr:transposase [Enterococcus avium]MDB1730327.1 transposase [Enterococcus avium]MDB1734576.1 transposase [Enterococcus avium]
MSRRQRRTYSKEFKQQVVDLYLAGKPRAEIIRDGSVAKFYQNVYLV